MFDCSIEETPPTVTQEDIARGWRLWEVRTNCNFSYSMPEGAALPPNRPDGATDLDVFFTHGFNVNAGDARAWGSEVFKRLWQSGSNANFHMLPWRGDYRLIDQSDLTTDLSALHYQHNAWFAQRTGGALKRYVEAAQPVAAKRILMTQSLGNMVACEALREGLQVGQYYMFDAAIPSEQSTKRSAQSRGKTRLLRSTSPLRGTTTPTPAGRRTACPQATALRAGAASSGRMTSARSLPGGGVSLGSRTP